MKRLTKKAIAAHIYYHPYEHIMLLQEFGYPINGNASKIKIAEAVVDMLYKNNAEYNNALAELIYKKQTRNTSNFLSFLEDLFGEGEDSEGAASLKGGGGGFDPVTAIANAVGSIFNSFTSSNMAKNEKEKAKSEMVEEMAKIEVEKQRRKTKQQIAMILASTGIVSISIWAAVNLRKSKA
jgi:hypothetical protein